MRIVTIDIGHEYPRGTFTPEQVESTATGILTSAGFDGHTITHGTGYWRGEREGQTTVRIYAEHDHVSPLRAAAAKIRDTLQQEAVGFTVQAAVVEFV